MTTLSVSVKVDDEQAQYFEIVDWSSNAQELRDRIALYGAGELIAAVIVVLNRLMTREPK